MTDCAENAEDESGNSGCARKKALARRYSLLYRRRFAHALPLSPGRRLPVGAEGPRRGAVGDAADPADRRVGTGVWTGDHRIPEFHQSFPLTRDLLHFGPSPRAVGAANSVPDVHDAVHRAGALSARIFPDAGQPAARRGSGGFGTCRDAVLLLRGMGPAGFRNHALRLSVQCTGQRRGSAGTDRPFLRALPHSQPRGGHSLQRLADRPGENACGGDFLRHRNALSARAAAALLQSEGGGISAAPGGAGSRRRPGVRAASGHAFGGHLPAAEF